MHAGVVDLAVAGDRLNAKGFDGNDLTGIAHAVAIEIVPDGQAVQLGAAQDAVAVVCRRGRRPRLSARPPVR